jgi:hypothetical protein
VLKLIQWIKTDNLDTKIAISFIEQPLNTHETILFEKYWLEQGANSVVIRKLHSAAGAVINVADILRKNQGNFIRKPCLYPWERIVLNPRGYLSFCPADWSNGSSIVDYQPNNVTVSKIWGDIFYQRLRKAHLDNNYAAHSFCGQCPDWDLIAWPGEGRGYADLIEEMKS